MNNLMRQLLCSPAVIRRSACLCFLVCLTMQLLAQQSAPSPAAPAAVAPQEQTTEMAVKDEATTAKVAEAAKFRVNVRLVLARVVVRDGSGHAVGNLHKEDFELFDNGKRQVISNFDMVGASVLPSETVTVTKPVAGEVANPVTPPVFPTRYVAYLFDDLRLDFESLARVREAARARMENLAPTDRAAIFSTSGKTVLDFTDDRAKLKETLDALRPQPTPGSEPNQCPDITFYMADLIYNRQDSTVLQTAVDDYIRCANVPHQMWNSVAPLVQNR